MSSSRSAPSPYADRLARLRAAMREKRIDGYLIANRMDQLWLTGFTGEDGQVLVTDSAVTLLTDGRFDETAETEAPWARRVLRVKRGPDATVRCIRRSKLARIGFEPGHLSVLWYTEMAKGLRPARLTPTSGLISTMRMVKDGGEVNAIRSAIRLAEKAFANVTREPPRGITEAQLAARLTFEMRSLGAQGDAFSPIVACGATSSLPHYEPSNRVLNGEGILIDWGCRVGWYVSDLTRMVWPRSIPAELGTAHEAVRAAHDAAIAAIRPGLRASAVDQVARRVIAKYGFDKQFNHALGHGIGLDVHEAPRLGKKSADVLQPGMVVTIEPGVYLPGVGGVRLEDDVLVTETGHEVLSSLPL